MAAASSHQHITSQHICKKCKKSFPLHHMYACNHGYYLCSGCYHQINKESRYSVQELSVTNSEHDIARSSHLVNQPSFYNVALVENESQPVGRKQHNMFPNPSVYQQNAIGNSLISLASICKPSLLNLRTLSKRPITCPQYDCRKTIAVSCLDMHFYREHKQVATVLTQLESRNCLEFNFDDLRGKNRNICLVLLTLEQQKNRNSNPEEDTSTTQRTINSIPSRTLFQPSKPFFILVAAKMPTDLKDENVDDSSETQFVPSERVFFYVTSNLTSNYSYTVAASTPSQNIRLKYFGPVLSVNEEFHKLCEGGKGLILNHQQINVMSNDCNQPVNLDLIIHERDDQINYYAND